MKQKKPRILAAILLCLLAVGVLFGVYVGDYYHADAAADALRLQTMLRESGATGSVLSVCYEPVTGSHVGPGTVALFFYGQSWR